NNYGAAGTVFPSSIGLSQTWDEDLMYQIGDVVAKESEANGGSIGRLAPVLDLLRDPRYGRAYETLGEDAYLTGSLGTAYAGGMNQRTDEGHQQFIPILKHVLGYNTEVNRLWLNSVLPLRSMKEYYEKVFRYTVEGGVSKSLMNSYPLINGKPMSIHPVQNALLNVWTPDYEGTGHYEFTTRNDAGSGSSLFVHSQRYFEDNPDGRALGVAEGVLNGEMSWSFRVFGNVLGPLHDAVTRGMIDADDLKENAKRAIAMNLRMGDYDQFGIQSPYFANATAVRSAVVKQNRQLALRASQEQIVLLKNEDNTLPLPASTSQAALIGPLADQVLKDHYTGPYSYLITIKDALENKLGADNVGFTRAIDTVAIQASNGQYLQNPENNFRAAGSAGTTTTVDGQTVITSQDNPVLANGGTTKPTLDDKPLLFEIHDYGSTFNLIRTPINNRYLQVTSWLPNVNPVRDILGHTLINNTSSPGEANLETGRTQYVLYQNFRIVPTDDGKVGLYNMVTGNGSNNPEPDAKAYDADDEDLNHGSYLKIDTSGRIVTDLTTTGPYRNERHTDGPDITESPVDTDDTDEVIDHLPAADKFVIDSVQSSEEAIDAAVADLDDDAPVILVLGYEPHLNAKEAIDLYHTGLSAQQLRIIDHVTGNGPGQLDRDVILIVKTSNPMTIDADVQNNDKIKAILEISHSGQEEGSALVSALFADGYEVPATGFAPAKDTYAPYGTYTEYPGYLDANGKIAPYAPAGRLSATWYQEITDLKGASEDHPPASYEFPEYNETTNDNQSNMHGTINTGLNIYDIIKGERTYQYYRGQAPLYAFGYGLTYTPFVYSDVAVSAVTGGRFTVTGKVTNTGDTYTSDEVVQVYSALPDASRIDQPIKRLIAYERLLAIAPNETETFIFDVDLRDKLGVWDVESGQFIVEPGTYTITVGGTSALTPAAGNNATLTVTTSNGGTAAPARDLTKAPYTLAEAFDDYSDVGGRVDDVELISESVDYDSNTVVQFRKDGAWISFKNAAFGGTVPTQLTVRVGSDRAGSLNVYALAPGADPAALSSTAPIAAFTLADTRPVSGLGVGLGIGPIGAWEGGGVQGSANPGTKVGQDPIYANAYIKPAWTVVSEDVTLTAGSYDLYFVTSNRGSALDWVKFGPASDSAATSIEISQVYNKDAILVKEGTLPLRAALTPPTATDTVTWAVTDTTGGATALAAIDSKGVLTAAGTANGSVRVTATAGGKTDTLDVLITNQLDSNKVNIAVPTAAAPNPAPQLRTVEYLQLRTGGAFGQTDSIQRYRGTNQQTAVFGELFSENEDQTFKVGENDEYYLPNVYRVAPADAITWQIRNEDPTITTALAEIDDTGLVTATGAADGNVVITAALKNNPDISVERTITLQNQGAKDPYKIIQAEHWDTSNNTSAPAATYAAGGNELGLYQAAAFAPVSEGSAAYRPDEFLYKNIDFGAAGANLLRLRMASAAAATVEVWNGAAKIGTLYAAPSGSVSAYRTYPLALERQTGVQDLTLKVTSGSVRLNYFQFADGDTVTVTYNTGGGSAVESQLLAKGAAATAPNTSRSGYSFKGWYTSATGGSAWDFDTAVNSDITLYAQWQSTSSPSGGTSTPITPVPPDIPSGPLDKFSDAGQISDWAVEFVKRLVEAEVITGRPNGTVDPRGNVTRAEFTKMIVLGLGLEAGETPKAFTDVAAGDWFKSVVDTASSRGVVQGVSETS
ncbi:MAG: glycoside hydrolase family 3 C-terminal domain-containing protein, partial [Oscillospiraceae bacterium]|nr:glycoside hydrolase family 3 C-terminal domain-containing protein [Oscillospiraceae bacterium]